MARRPQRDSFSRLREKGRLRLRQPPSEDLARCHQPERFGRDGSISEEVGSGRFGAGGVSSTGVFVDCFGGDGRRGRCLRAPRRQASPPRPAPVRHEQARHAQARRGVGSACVRVSACASALVRTARRRSPAPRPRKPGIALSSALPSPPSSRPRASARSRLSRARRPPRRERRRRAPPSDPSPSRASPFPSLSSSPSDAPVSGASWFAVWRVTSSIKASASSAGCGASPVMPLASRSRPRPRRRRRLRRPSSLPSPPSRGASALAPSSLSPSSSASSSTRSSISGTLIGIWRATGCGMPLAGSPRSTPQ